MQFARYTNMEKKTGRRIRVNGEVIDETVPSYDPSTDLTSPANWIPMECMSNVTYKHDAQLVAMIKKGTQLEKDLWQQIQSIFENMRSIAVFYAELEEFFATAGAAFGTEEEAGGAGAEAEEPPATDAAAGDDNTFTVPNDLVQEGGGGAPTPHPIVIDQLG